MVLFYDLDKANYMQDILEPYATSSLMHRYALYLCENRVTSFTIQKVISFLVCIAQLLMIMKLSTIIIITIIISFLLSICA